MFEIATNTKGVTFIVTDNPKIAEGARGESDSISVWFTGAANLKVARGLADGLAKEFDRKVVIWRSGPSMFHARFAKGG